MNGESAEMNDWIRSAYRGEDADLGENVPDPAGSDDDNESTGSGGAELEALRERVDQTHDILADLLEDLAGEK